MIPVAIKSTFENNFAPTVSKLFSPKILGRITTKLPLSLNQKVVSKLINLAFVEQVADGDFGFLAGKRLQIEIIDAMLFVGITFKHQQICCYHFDNVLHTADATLSINTIDAISLLEQSIDPDTLFFQRKLKISGNTELAHHVKNTIDTLNLNIIPKHLMSLVATYKKQILQKLETKQ